MTAPASLQLICPGLLGPVPALPQPMPPTGAVERLLGRADSRRDDWSDPFSALFGVFGLSYADERDLPSAPISLLGEGADVDPDAYWLHADPIHLRPDRDRLLLFAGESVAPDRVEADALLAAFNDHFADERLRLVAPTPNRWYLRIEVEPPPSAVPLHRMLGQPLEAVRSATLDARRWSSLLNEIQMLFHAHPVNRVRMDCGYPAISGLWVWGGGRLPKGVDTDLRCVIADHPLALGLARLAGLDSMALARSAFELPVEKGRALVFWDALWHALEAHDLDAWGAALGDLDAWMGRIETELRHGTLSALDIQTGDGQALSIGRRHLRRFWRKGGFSARLRVG
ncbi:phosphoglycerate mutase [Thiorhodococcus fuscus]|uniref:Phosphoglycerate mutase n=1 Tax=Thiorhodococcus fuscus TaxID=527200 RepID=A0ABW4YA37_9GAMM